MRLGCISPQAESKLYANELFLQISFFYHCTTAQVGQGLIIENSRSHTDTPHSIGLLWMSDQPPTKRTAPDNTQHSQETEIHAPLGFEPAIPASEWPQTHVLGRAAIGIGFPSNYPIKIRDITVSTKKNV